MTRLAVVVAFLSTVLALAPRPSEACSQAEAEVESGPIINIPTAGIVPVFVYNKSGETVTDETVTVVDPSGAVIAGTFTYDGFDRIVWRADAELDADTTYTMTIARDGFADDVLEFTTVADAPPESPALVASLRGSHIASELACCESEENCGGPTCFRLAYEADWTLSASLDVELASSRFFKIRPARGSLSRQVVTARFPFGEPRYCIDATIVDIFRGTETPVTACADIADADEGAVAPEPDEIDESVCTGDLVDPETNERIDTSGGCSATSSPIGGAAALLVGLLLAGLGRTRRSR